ncbi:MAG: M48 family metalloprotease [Bryobacteraceae bacterium]
MLVRRVVVLMLAGLSLTAQEPIGPAKNGVNSCSLEEEAALGKQVAAHFRQRTKPIDSPNVQNYLERLGKRIAAQMPHARLPFTFSVIADDPCITTHEPAALLGGYVFVPAALFAAAQDEAEFAGMLAHAMGHIAQRHGTGQATRGTIINYGCIPLIFMGGWTGRSVGHSAPLGLVAIERSAELEADLLAVQTMARAGFDPKALVRYVERVQVRPPGTTSKAYSPLPDRDQRISALLAAIEELPTVDYAAAASSEFAAAQQEVGRLTEPLARNKTPPSLMRKTPD